MSFGNPVVGQEDLIRDAIRSVGYVKGVSGWRIAKNGDAEFNTGTFRGSLNVTSTNGSYVRALLTGGQAVILIEPPNFTGYTWNPAVINGQIGSPGSGVEFPILKLASPWDHNTINPPSGIALIGPTAVTDDNAIFIDANNIKIKSSGTNAETAIAVTGNLTVNSPSNTTSIFQTDLSTQGAFNSSGVTNLSTVSNSVTIGNYGAITGAWTSYSPSWLGSVSNGTISNGSLVGHYQQAGSLFAFTLKLTIGSLDTIATGAWSFTLPISTDRDSTASVFMLDSSATARYTGTASINAANDIFRIATGAGGNVGVSSTVPFTWATGDTLTISGLFSAA